jgi:hypothetical protein
MKSMKTHRVGVKKFVYPCLVEYINKGDLATGLVVLKNSPCSGTVMYAPQGSNHCIGDHKDNWCYGDWVTFDGDVTINNNEN